MTNIAINFQPFLKNQTIYTYSDGNLIEETSVTIDEMPAAVSALSNKFGADEIDLIGNQDYLARFKAELSTKFNNNVNINIIGR